MITKELSDDVYLEIANGRIKIGEVLAVLTIEQLQGLLNKEVKE